MPNSGAGGKHKRAKSTLSHHGLINQQATSLLQRASETQQLQNASLLLKSGRQNGKKVNAKQLTLVKSLKNVFSTKPS